MRLLIVVLSAMALAFPLGATATAEEESAHVIVQTATPADPAATTAPSGPDLKPETESDKAQSRRKLVMGIASVVLIGIVIWGRSVRRKRKKADAS